MRKRAVVVAAVAAVILSAIWAAPTIPHDEVYGVDGPATKTAVLRLVPLASSVEFAKTAMAAKGFHCRMMYNQLHVGFDPTNPQRFITHPAADFLWCDSGDLWLGWRSLVISKRWQIVFVTKDQKVVSVDVGVGLTGP